MTPNTTAISTHLPVLRHNGVYGEVNWNRTLAAPLIKSMSPKRDELYNQWNRSAGITLRNKLSHAGVQVLQDIIRSASSYDPALLKSVEEHVHRAMSLIIEDTQKIQRIIIDGVLDGDERDSRPNALIKAVETKLGDVYWRAHTTIKGKNSTVRQKVRIVRLSASCCAPHTCSTGILGRSYQRESGDYVRGDR